MTPAEIIAFNRGVRAVIGLAGQVGGLVETDVVAAGESDAASAATTRRILDEFARQAAILLKPEPAGRQICRPNGEKT